MKPRIVCENHKDGVIYLLHEYKGDATVDHYDPSNYKANEDYQESIESTIMLLHTKDGTLKVHDYVLNNRLATMHHATQALEMCIAANHAQITRLHLNDERAAPLMNGLYNEFKKNTHISQLDIEFKKAKSMTAETLVFALGIMKKSSVSSMSITFPNYSNTFVDTTIDALNVTNNLKELNIIGLTLPQARYISSGLTKHSLYIKSSNGNVEAFKDTVWHMQAIYQDMFSSMPMKLLGIALCCATIYGLSFIMPVIALGSACGPAIAALVVGYNTKPALEYTIKLRAPEPDAKVNGL